MGQLEQSDDHYFHPMVLVYCRCLQILIADGQIIGILDWAAAADRQSPSCWGVPVYCCCCRQVVLIADRQIITNVEWGSCSRLTVHSNVLLLVSVCCCCLQVVLIADGQITAGPKVVKPNARKLRRLATEPQPSLGGFAGEQV
jgi:hypothetical protein